jgi:DNA-binding XRE family transcriptional regulator
MRSAAQPDWLTLMNETVPLVPRRQQPDELEPLWRTLLGRRIRELRLERGERLAETAERAGMSPQYLSEVERGLKEPSSEMVAALAGALESSLLELATSVTEHLRGAEQLRPNRMPTAQNSLLLAA